MATKRGHKSLVISILLNHRFKGISMKITSYDQYLDQCLADYERAQDDFDQPWLDFLEENDQEDAWQVMCSEPWLLNRVADQLDLDDEELKEFFEGRTLGSAYDDLGDDSEFAAIYNEYHGK
jgi:hypothetical protein